MLFLNFHFPALNDLNSPLYTFLFCHPHGGLQRGKAV